MPAWKLTWGAMLMDTLRALGLREAFDASRADFSAMTAVTRLHLTFVVHQAVVEVTAQGIEAAAATAGGLAESAGAEPHLVLDRPFAWALLHEETATPLFVGQVADPTADAA